LGLALGLEASMVEAIARFAQKLDILITWTGLAACQLNGWIGPCSVDPDRSEVTVLAGWLRFAADSPLRRQAKAALQSMAVIHPAIVAHQGSLDWRRPAVLFPAPGLFGRCPRGRCSRSRCPRSRFP
jgi:hypothetical protein